MGRKSNKEKKQRRKEEKKEEDAVLAVKQQLVDAANQIEDPMSLLLPFQKFDRNGIKAKISFHRADALDDETKEWVFGLTKANMQSLYEMSEQGWSDEAKRDEMLESAARYLIARDIDTGKPVALVHFRFDTDFDDAVLYCYEIQLEKAARRKGLGKFLMQTLELMAHKTQMEKLMLTVFRHNEDAYNFFKKTLKFTLDETSPEETLAEALYEEHPVYTYEILSKCTLPKRKPLATHTQTNAQPASVAAH